MNEAPLLWDCMPMVMGLAFGMFCLGLGIGLTAGFWWGKTITSGDTTTAQDLCDRLNQAEAEIERLKEELRHGLSID